MTRTSLVNLLLTAQMQGQLAAAVYGGPVQVAELAQRLGADHRFIEYGHACAGALIFYDWVHISVGGTNDRLDWAQNASTQGTQYCGLTVHKGFAQAANWLHDELIRIGLDRQVAHKPLVLGGHSAGGAIAELIAMRVAFHPHEVVTFGAPRVFADDSSATYGAFSWKNHRFVMDGDPVPHLPIRGLGWLLRRPEYRHAAHAIRLSKRGSVSSVGFGLMDYSWWMTKTVMAWIQAVAGSFSSVCSVVSSGHAIERYNSAIDKGLKNAAS